MTFLLSVLAGAIGANFASGLWHRYALSGVINIAIGIIAGTAIWTLSQGFGMREPSMSVLMGILTVGSLSGAVFSIALGSLHRVLHEEQH